MIKKLLKKKEREGNCVPGRLLLLALGLHRNFGTNIGQAIRAQKNGFDGVDLVAGCFLVSW
jgi:hypothetical protein